MSKYYILDVFFLKKNYFALIFRYWKKKTCQYDIKIYAFRHI